MKPSGISKRLTKLGGGIPHDKNASTVLSFGVTNFQPPDFFTQAVEKASDIANGREIEDSGLSQQGEIHTYISESGHEKLQQQIKEKWLESDFQAENIEVSVEDGSEPGVVITCGGQAAIYTAIGGILDNDQKLMVFSPYYPYHHNAAVIHTSSEDAVSVVETNAEDDFEPDLDEVERKLENEDIAAIAICSPNNPTGQSYSEEFLKELSELCVEHNTYVISDEVYTFLRHDNKDHRSIQTFPGMTERTIVVGSFSKALGVTGWRLGFMVCPSHLEEDMVKFNDHINIHPPTICQVAMAEALDSVEELRHIDSWNRKLEDRRDLITSPFKESDKTVVAEPEGAFYLMTKLKEKTGKKLKSSKYEKQAREKLEENGIERDPNQGECFKQYLIDEADVQVMQGTPFGKAAENYIRIAYGASEKEELKDASRRIERALERL